MKKFLILLLITHTLVWGQVKSGTSYSEHPAYDVITESYRVFESGTEAELRALFTEDAKIWGPGEKEAGTVDEEVTNMIWWQENFKDIKLISYDNNFLVVPDLNGDEDTIKEFIKSFE